jgi:hypothetical protein
MALQTAPLPVRRAWHAGTDRSVEDLGGDGDLGGPGLVAVETRPVTNDLLSARELAQRQAEHCAQC